jgi:hypothetical protein
MSDALPSQPGTVHFSLLANQHCVWCGAEHFRHRATCGLASSSVIGRPQ